MNSEEYISYDATALASLVTSGEVTPTELLNSAVAAAEKVNGELNAIVDIFPEDAIAQIEQGLPNGPFRGVPFLLKDLTADLAGRPTGSGWAPRLSYPSSNDSELVRRFKAAGLTIFGKTAVPELAMDWTTRSTPHGVTSNPWNLNFTVGTSSGGSAAAVAAGIVPMAHGNDGGGSIRVPASCCGCFGLKPTRGRNPAAPAGATWQGMLVEHVLTRSVRDSAAMLDATAGSTSGQFYTSPPKIHLRDEIGQDPGKLKVGLLIEAPYGAPTHTDCLAAVEFVAELLTDLGHVCAPIVLSLPENGWSSFETFILAEYATDMKLEEKKLGRPLIQEDFPAPMWAMIEVGNTISAVDLNIATTGLHEVARRVCTMFREFDVVLSPSLAQPPLSHDKFPSDLSVKENFAFYLSWMPYTHIYNISGSPAVSLPLYWNTEGLPIGVQFAAPPQGEAKLIRLASQLEAALPWVDRKPSTHA